MNNRNRTENSIINLIIGSLCQIITIFVSFISRTIFIKYLGNDYLGINGLYTNILSMLSLAELGIGNVMLYSLYKPICEKDENKISSYVNFYKKVYIIIATSILVMGLSLIPFLNKIIKETTLNNVELIWYYVLFLLDSVFSYLFIYKSTLINADQKNYIVKKFTTYFSIICKIVQIFILIITRNYYIYLICQIIFTIMTNFAISKKADSLYPFLKTSTELSKDVKKSIFVNIKATFVYKLSSKVLTSTDNIIISIILGTIWVGYYSNYSLIITALNSAILIISNAIISSIGNLNAQEKEEKNFQIFKVLIVIFHWIIAFCTIEFVIVSKKFITIWIGEEFVLNNLILFSIAFNFFLAGIEIPVWLYREALGLFDKVKNITFICAILNIILSFILGKLFGLFGILFSTALSKLLTTSWFEPKILFKESFKKQKVLKYFLLQTKLFIISIISLLCTIMIMHYVTHINNFIDIIIYIIIGAIVTNLIFYISLKKSEEYIYIKNNLFSKIWSKIKKIHKQEEVNFQ